MASAPDPRRARPTPPRRRRPPCPVRRPTSSATAGDGQVPLTWIAPASDGGSPITGYTVTASPGSGTCSTTGATSCTVSGLTNGTPYTFTVTATNAVGTGPESNAANATPQAAATVPGAPTNLVATAGDTTVQLTWTAPASDGGSPITGYTVTGSPGGTCSTTGATTCTVSGLTNGTLYTFHVTATNAVGTGPESNAASATPQAAATVPGAPTNLAATAGDTTVQLTWTAPTDDGGSPITGYTVTGSPGGTCSTTGATTLHRIGAHQRDPVYVPRHRHQCRRHRTAVQCGQRHAASGRHRARRADQPTCVGEQVGWHRPHLDGARVQRGKWHHRLPDLPEHVEQLARVPGRNRQRHRLPRWLHGPSNPLLLPRYRGQ